MKTVVLCGSNRSKSKIREFANVLKESGVTVFEPHFMGNAPEWQTASDEFRRAAALGLTHDHFQKIRTADVVFIYNEDGYMGNSCTLELGFAIANNKPVYALMPDKDEICRDILIKEIIKTPQELIERLK